MNDDQITGLLQDLVRIPSVTPRGDPGTEARNTGEKQMAEYLADFFRKLGLDVELQEVEPGRPNLIAKFASRGGKRSLALAPHTDTVSVAGMTIDPFGGEIRDGRLFGRGACDTKGSIASMMAAMANILPRRDFRAGDCDVYFCGLMGEEGGNDGARALMERGFRVDFAIAGEPTECRVVYTHKGALWFKLITRGQTAHGAMPDRGVNAIGKMAPVIGYLLGEYQEKLRELTNPALGSPTVNISIIRGGSQINIVPAVCEIEVDRRTLPGEDHEKIQADLRRKFAALPIETAVIRDCVPLLTDPANPFIQKMAAAGTAAEPVLLSGAPWFCDAAIFAAHGVPAVGFGPGSAGPAHTPDEFIELHHLFRATRILERFLFSCV